MNYAETFEQFSSRVSTMDLVLYAGAGLVIYTLFKHKIDPVKDYVLNTVNALLNKKNKISTSAVTVVPAQAQSDNQPEIFLDLIVSWKRTRDLAVQNNCSEAVKVADQMFPFLSPSGCKHE